MLGLSEISASENTRYSPHEKVYRYEQKISDLSKITFDSPATDLQKVVHEYGMCSLHESHYGGDTGDWSIRIDGNSLFFTLNISAEILEIEFNITTRKFFVISKKEAEIRELFGEIPLNTALDTVTIPSSTQEAWTVFFGLTLDAGMTPFEMMSALAESMFLQFPGR
jgi:hypothetical protein